MTTDDIQKLYIAYFNRPADPAGLQYWMQSGASLGDIADSFSRDVEYTARFKDLDRGAIVRQVYQNLFGREGDAQGVAYWQDLLDKGTLHVADVVTAIYGGAQGSDAQALDHKVIAASLFNQTLVTTPGAISAYTGGTANAVASAWLDSVADLVTIGPTPPHTDLQASVDHLITLISAWTLPNVVLGGHVNASGAVAGATVFLDLNDNGAVDSGETSTVTNSSGAYQLFANVGEPFTHENGTVHVAVRALGGTDQGTHQASQMVFSSGFDLQYFYNSPYWHGIGNHIAHLDFTPDMASPMLGAGVILTGAPEGVPA